MTEEIFVWVYIAGWILIPAATAFGHGAGWWNADLGDEAGIGWVIILGIWPFAAVCLLAAGVAFLVIGLPVIAMYYCGKKLRN